MWIPPPLGAGWLSGDDDCPWQVWRWTQSLPLSCLFCSTKKWKFVISFSNQDKNCLYLIFLMFDWQHYEALLVRLLKFLVERAVWRGQWEQAAPLSQSRFEMSDRTGNSVFFVQTHLIISSQWSAGSCLASAHTFVYLDIPCLMKMMIATENISFFRKTALGSEAWRSLWAGVELTLQVLFYLVTKSWLEVPCTCSWQGLEIEPKEKCVLCCADFYPRMTNP